MEDVADRFHRFLSPEGRLQADVEFLEEVSKQAFVGSFGIFSLPPSTLITAVVSCIFAVPSLRVLGLPVVVFVFVFVVVVVVAVAVAAAAAVVVVCV